VQYEGEVSRELRAEEFIGDTGSALMYIIEQNGVLEELDVYAEEISCSDLDYEQTDEDSIDDEFEENRELATLGDSAAEEEKLDELGEGLYLCRWPNADFSVVKAENKRGALVQLDEWAEAEASWLVPLETFMADFRLSDLGAIEFKTFGEETHDFIRSSLPLQ
jgi:hypothetical protein